MKKLKKGRGLRIFSAMLCAALLLGAAAVASTSDSGASSKVKISKSKVTLYKGQTYKLKVKGTSETIKWSSSKKGVATVSKSGKVKAKKAGTTWIKAKVGKKTYKCKVKVSNSVSLNKTSITVDTGYEGKLKVKGGTATKWSSSDTSVVEVNSDTGKIFASSYGDATITAKVGGKKLKCKVKVRYLKNGKPFTGVEDNEKSRDFVAYYYKGLPCSTEAEMKAAFQAYEPIKTFLNDYIYSKGDNLTDYQKIAAIRAYMRDLDWSYTTKALYDGKLLFDAKKGVCHDAAVATTMLCQAVDLKCYYVQTKTHADNVVCVDGNWFEIDMVGTASHSKGTICKQNKRSVCNNLVGAFEFSYHGSAGGGGSDHAIQLLDVISPSDEQKELMDPSVWDNL